MSEEEKKATAEINLEKELNLSKDFIPPTYDEWKEKVIADLKGAPFEKKLLTKTYEGITLQPIYRQENIKNIPYLHSKPGYTDYLRSTKASGYVGKPWEIAQELPYALPKELNKALKSDIERGQTAINIKLDEATKLGIDADKADTEMVGKNGVSISTPNCFETIFEEIDITKHPIFIECGFSALPILTTFNSYLKKDGKPISQIKGSIEADPIGYLAVEGTMPISLEEAYNQMKNAIEWSEKNNTEIKTIRVSALPYHDSGSNAVQEVAFALATASEYLSEMVERGIDVNVAAQNIRFTFGIGTFYFMEIAKLRASRILWAKIVEAYGGNEEARKMNIHGRTSRYNQTIYDPYVNMLRTTTEAFSAVIGGVDSLHTSQFDELFGLPNDFSRRIARNVQILLKEESHLDSLIDPAGGSFYIEHLTYELSQEIWKLFQVVDEKGGITEILKSGFIQEEIDKVVEARNKNLAKRKERIVGSNMYANTLETKIEEKRVDSKKVKEEKTKILRNYKSSSKNSSEETADKILENFESNLTLGDIFAILNKARKETSITPLKMHRAAEIFEILRDASSAYKEKHGEAPKIFLANMGLLKQHKARADFSRGFFEVGGFEVVYSKGFETTDDAVKAALDSGIKAVCICSTDDTYPELVPPIAKGIKEANKDVTLILAGYPKDQIEAHKESGIDEFIFLGADVYKIVSNLLTKIGALQ